MERFKANINDYLTDEQIEQIKPDLKDVCEPRESWNPREVERSMCYHALGHLHMYITNGDLSRSSELCKDVGTKSDGRNYVQTCTEGVFMTIYQPLGPEDIALVKNITPKPEKMFEFCAKYKNDEMSFHACHKEAWAIFRQELYIPEGYIKFCTYTDDLHWQDSCFRSVMNPLTDEKIINDNNIQWLYNFCNQLPDFSKNICIYASVQRLMQVDPKLSTKALEVCKGARALGEKGQNSCFMAMVDFSRLGYHRGSSEFTQYCALMPEEWENKCLNNGN